MGYSVFCCCDKMLLITDYDIWQCGNVLEEGLFPIACLDVKIIICHWNVVHSILLSDRGCKGPLHLRSLKRKEYPYT